MNNKFFLIRHGENKPDGDHGLTQFGMKQAAWAASKLPKGVLVISSTIDRTLQTAEIISGVVGSSVIRDERLKERMDFGEIDGLGFTNYRKLVAQSNQDPNFELPNGMSVTKKGQQMAEVLNEYRLCENSIFVSHAGAILDLLKNITGDVSDEAWQRFRTPYASITTIEYGGEDKIIKQIFCPFAKNYDRS